jgi:hypothetical protein
MHIMYRKIVGEQMNPAPPLLSRLMYSARLQNREVHYLLFDHIALQIPDAPTLACSSLYVLDWTAPPPIESQ